MYKSATLLETYCNIRFNLSENEIRQVVSMCLYNKIMEIDIIPSQRRDTCQFYVMELAIRFLMIHAIRFLMICAEDGKVDISILRIAKDEIYERRCHLLSSQRASFSFLHYLLSITRHRDLFKRSPIVFKIELNI